MQPASDVWFPSSHELKSRDRDTPGVTRPGVTRPGVTVVLTGHAQRDLFPPQLAQSTSEPPPLGWGARSCKHPVPRRGHASGSLAPRVLLLHCGLRLLTPEYQAGGAPPPPFTIWGFPFQSVPAG